MQTSSLANFWPGIEAHMGNTENSENTIKTLFSIWKHFGFMPEKFYKSTDEKGNLNFNTISQEYPLRPEFIES
jgi:hypothetical protein